MANNIEIKDANGAITSLKTTELTTNVHSPHHIIQEISGSNITSVVNALNEISASVKTGGSVQTVTSSAANPLWVTASLANPLAITGTIGVDVQISDLITVTSSLTNPVGITGSATINNLAYTTYNASTYTSNVNAFTLVGSSSNRADVDSSGSQKVGIFGPTNNRALVDSVGSLQVTGSTTINNTSFTSYAGSTHTGNVTNIALIGSSSYKAEVDVSGSQKVGLFGANNNRSIIDSLGSLQVGVFSSAGNRQTVDSSGAAQITGSTTVNNTSFTVYSGATHTGNVTNTALIGSSSNKADVDSSGSLKIGIFGATNNRVIVDSAGSLQITGSATINNLKDTAYNSSTHTSNLTPVAIIGPSGYRLQTDVSGSSVITSSYLNPVVVTASFSQPLGVKVTSSNSDFPYVRQIVPTGAIRNVFSTSDSSINFGDLTNLGAFQIATNNISRRGLTITNPTSQRLFIAIATQASSSNAGRNGFDLPNNNNDPNSYSFIIYPSGSFFADSTNVTLFYGGFFVSSSANLKVLVTETY